MGSICGDIYVSIEICVATYFMNTMAFNGYIVDVLDLIRIYLDQSHLALLLVIVN